MDSDQIFTIAELLYSKVKNLEELKEKLMLTKIITIKHGGRISSVIKNARFIDVGFTDLDHHGKEGKTSFDLAVEEVEERNFTNEDSLNTPRKILYNADLLGISNPFDVNDMAKAIGHTEISQREKIKIGTQIAYLILRFYQEKIQRNAPLTQKVIKEFFEEKKKKMPPRFQKYYTQLDNPKFQRPCDLVEVISANAQISEEEKAMELGKQVLDFLYKDSLRYEEAKKESKRKHVKIGIPGSRHFLTLIRNTKNPKDHVVALAKGAVAVIQTTPDGNVQIFFKSKVPKWITDIIIGLFRKVETFYHNNRKFPSAQWLTEKGTIKECPEWHYFVGDAKKNGQRGIFILNGSLTAPNVPPTKIPVGGMVSIIALTIGSN